MQLRLARMSDPWLIGSQMVGSGALEGELGDQIVWEVQSVGEAYLRDRKEKEYGFLNYLEPQGNLWSLMAVGQEATTLDTQILGRKIQYPVIGLLILFSIV